MTRRRVVVVGGGVFGGCAAYELAKGGADVTVVERDPVGVHASGRNPGNLNPLLATPPELQAFALACFGLHETLLRELTELECPDYHVEPVRRVLACLSDEEMRELEPIEPLFAGQIGFAARWLDGDEVRAIDPRLSGEIVGGMLLEGSRSLDARVFNRALLEGAVRRGARLLAANATGVDRRPGGGHVVRTDHGALECDALVLASGPWVAETRDWLGLDLPVEPVKGEMLRVRLPGAPLTHDVTRGLVSLYRRGEGEVWVGVTRESGLDEQPTEEGRRLLFEGATRLMPAIADALLIEHVASSRPMTANGLPLVGPVPGLDGVHVANGGGIKGVLLCAGVGRAVADLILTGATDLPVAEFAL